MINMQKLFFGLSVRTNDSLSKTNQQYSDALLKRINIKNNQNVIRE